MKFLYTLVTACLVLTGCAKDPIAISQTDNFDIKLDKLFTHDGCNIYRFEDGGRDHYYADCRGNVSDIRSCGKGCTTTEDTVTVK